MNPVSVTDIFKQIATAPSVRHSESAIGDNSEKNYVQIAKDVISQIKECSSSTQPKEIFLEFFNAVDIKRCPTCPTCEVEINYSWTLYTKGIYLIQNGKRVSLFHLGLEHVHKKPSFMCSECYTLATEKDAEELLDEEMLTYSSEEELDLK